MPRRESTLNTLTERHGIYLMSLKGLYAMPTEKVCEYAMSKQPDKSEFKFLQVFLHILSLSCQRIAGCGDFLGCSGLLLGSSRNRLHII